MNMPSNVCKYFYVGPAQYVSQELKFLFPWEVPPCAGIETV